MTNGEPDSGIGRTPESVWDYPRPPAALLDDRHVVVEFAGTVIADSRRAVRVLETTHPPVFYLPADDVALYCLLADAHRSWCEWKGEAAYWNLKVGDQVSGRAAWNYPDPVDAYAKLAGHFAFYPTRVDRCSVNGETVSPQAGDFYGGWITSEIQGPFKGEPGTAGW
ncbi:DUF427 domain-containing protein [Streptomyces sp. NPDC091265]|uniref:DUF427 domain-containing protein n=1 Tax=unclassified Streptomyces TaxID=2593676 RepID=UPI00344CDCFC